MNAFRRGIVLLAIALPLCHGSAAETIYFLVAEPPGREWHNDSYVLPLSGQKDIDYARHLIRQSRSGFREGDRTIVVAWALPGSDGINRNYLDSRFPEWSWHVEFHAFAEIVAEILDGNATLLEKQFDDWSGNKEEKIPIGFVNYTVVKELGPQPLYLSIIPEDRQLQFYWTGLGTNHVYTLEGSESLTSTNWSAVAGASWPLRTNHWVLPRSDPTAALYRVRAEQSPPNDFQRSPSGGMLPGISMVTHPANEQ